RSGEEALASIEQYNPDLVLLDINLEHGRGQIDGVELGIRLRQQYRFPLIFITSYQDRKTQQRTDSIHPDGYLTKPISEAGLAFAIESALAKASETFIRPEPLPEVDQVPSDAEGSSYLLEDFLFVKEQAAYRKVPVSDIWFIKSDANYLNIHRREGPLLVSTNLANFARQFEHPSLLRVSRSHIINVQYIEGFEDQHTVIAAGQVIPIGKTYRQEVQRRFRFLKTSR
ncbi:MAG: response regulator transcription factor, partial [Bacteroidota bacterium]